MSDKNPKLRLAGSAIPVWDENLRQRLAAHIERHPHLNTVVLSRKQHVGYSRTALDAYLSREYPSTGSNRSKLEGAIRAYLDQVEGTERHGWANTFVKTRTYMQLEQACNVAREENAIVVAYGKPGVGKSRGLAEFSIRKMETAPIQILCSINVTTKYFLQKIARQIGVDGRQNIAALEDQIAEKLKRSPRPIFVDQANYLGEKALGSICYIWDIARIPIVLFGTKLLFDMFFSSRLTEDVRAQLSRRIAVHYPLDEMAAGEAKAVIASALGKDATDQNIATIIRVTGGIHGHVESMIRRILSLKKTNAARLASGDVKMEEIVNAAGTKLMIA